ncbi:MAG: YgeY family selenium metabolism-linked hydrolase [Gemmatimonadota bacterium]|nr:YgeY family selenium metabolism-linked hydrolase [Gemmatimonadota bacterium]
MTAPGRQALTAARGLQDEIVTFLRDMIAIPSESLHEGERCERIRQEYERLGLDEVRIDGLGNVVARVGSGPLVLLMDGHIDCVGVGDPSAWDFDPFEGKFENGKVFGRGAVDELPAVACMAYAAKLMKERGLLDGVTVYLSATVMEEDCDGYCLLHLIEQERIRPHVVIIGEPTDLNVYRGQRGRVELTITTKGVSSHAAHPERGVNAIYKMAPIIADIEALNERLPDDPFLGKGTVVVSSIECTTPSLNAVPDSAKVYVDRRMTTGETVDGVLAELRALSHLGDATIEVLQYNATSWRGTPASQEKFFPSWVVPEAHPLVQGVAQAVTDVLDRKPKISRWSFSTNGVASMGRLGIPTVGFAPGLEELAHTTEEWVAVDDLVRATAVYAMIPAVLAARSDALLTAATPSKG